MKIAILDYDGKPIYYPSMNRHLEVDLKAMLKPRWWQKRHFKWACEEIDRISCDLRQETARGEVVENVDG